MIRIALEYYTLFMKHTNFVQMNWINNFSFNLNIKK